MKSKYLGSDPKPDPELFKSPIRIRNYLKSRIRIRNTIYFIICMSFFQKLV
jgi:hypothetical protein